MGYVVMWPCAVSACSPGDLIGEVTAPLTIISDDFNIYNRKPLITLSPGNQICIDTNWTQANTSVLGEDQVGVYFRVGLKDYRGIASTTYLKKADVLDQPAAKRCPDGYHVVPLEPGLCNQDW